MDKEHKKLADTLISWITSHTQEDCYGLKIIHIRDYRGTSTMGEIYTYDTTTKKGIQITDKPYTLTHYIPLPEEVLYPDFSMLSQDYRQLVYHTVDKLLTESGLLLHEQSKGRTSVK